MKSNTVLIAEENCFFDVRAWIYPHYRAFNIKYIIIRGIKKMVICLARPFITCLLISSLFGSSKLLEHPDLTILDGGIYYGLRFIERND